MQRGFGYLYRIFLSGVPWVAGECTLDGVLSCGHIQCQRGWGVQDGRPVLVEDKPPSWCDGKVPERGGLNAAFQFFPVSWVRGGQERSQVCEGR